MYKIEYWKRRGKTGRLARVADKFIVDIEIGKKIGDF